MSRGLSLEDKGIIETYTIDMSRPLPKGGGVVFHQYLPPEIDEGEIAGKEVIVSMISVNNPDGSNPVPMKQMMGS